MADIYIGDSIKVTVTFRGWSDDGEQGPEEDPGSVVVKIYDTSTTPYALLDSDDPIKVTDSVSTYYYDWTPTDEGEFRVQFEGTFLDNSVDIIHQDFEVGLTTPDVPDATLGEDYVLVFGSNLEPMYIDPDLISYLYPHSSDYEIAEFIYLTSLEVQGLLGLKEGDIPPSIALEYIEAKAACSLDKIYGDISSDQASFRLGDFSITNRSSSNASATRTGARTWCELAAVLRREMLAGYGGKVFKGVVRGSNLPNPIPERKLKSY